jgi:hypothetical protein
MIVPVASHLVPAYRSGSTIISNSLIPESPLPENPLIYLVPFAEQQLKVVLFLQRTLRACFPLCYILHRLYKASSFYILIPILMYIPSLISFRNAVDIFFVAEFGGLVIGRILYSHSSHLLERDFFLHTHQTSFVNFTFGSGSIKHLLQIPRPYWVCRSIQLWLSIRESTFSHPSSHVFAASVASMAIMVQQKSLTSYIVGRHLFLCDVLCVPDQAQAVCGYW